jgi:hypothetical protein
MDTIAPSKYRPENTSPLRNDAPGTVTEMPSPQKIHHVHILSDVNYDAQVQFYKRLFNLDVVTERHEGFTFMTFDQHDHRVVVIKRPGWSPKPKQAVGFSHAAFCYASLGELIHVYKKMKGWGYTDNVHCTNHGNSTSFYYVDIDGNRVETMMDNFTPLETQDYKRHFQFTEEFGETAEADFDPEKMVSLYESGTPDSLLINREEVRRLVREGKL